MPAHSRRPKQSGAVARLPGSRLPLGTPQPPNRSQTTSRATNRSGSAGSSHTTNTTSDNASGVIEGDASNMADSSPPIMSLAEAKLQRQNERIHLAEAALANPPQLERSRPQSRAKSKPTMKSLDNSVYSGRSRATSVSSGGVAIETRVNSYRTEGPHLGRPYSRSSQDDPRTTNTEAVGMERQDSALDDTGFQTYTGRRNSRRGELGAYEDKPEVKQATVEATVDQREILAVFANPLPGLEFLASQAGWRNGQVQFIQHPNGDVSAHMWSLRSYQWDNIGQFSNIRKKIEGQLAGDHLKGETAYQKLQQNSLAYFRTIAKQREAATAGLDFGQTEIQQLLPDPAQAKLSASSKKLNAATPAFSQIAQDSGLAERQDARLQTTQQQRTIPQSIELVEPHSFYAVPQGSRVVDNHFQAPFSPKHVHTADDPFAASVFPSAFTQLGPEYSGGTVAGPARQAAPMGPPQPFDARKPSYGTYKSIPLPAVPDVRMPCKPLPASRTTFEDVGRSFGSNFLSRPSIPGVSAFLPARVAGTGPDMDRRHLSVASMESLRGKPVTPREAARENIFKIRGHAVERSLSRENLGSFSSVDVEHEHSQLPRRSVLHDPFKGDLKTECTSSSASRRSESEDHSTIMQTAARSVFSQKTGMPPCWKDSQPMRNKPLLLDSHLTNSEPDIVDDEYQSLAIYANPHGSIEHPRTSSSMHSSAKKVGVSPEKRLDDWWTSGSNFGRQEELYQSIQAISKPRHSMEIAAARVSAVANARRPTGTASTNGDILTRVLIPVYANLASYVEGPLESRRDYWSHWSQAPEWCIDRGPNGNKSFYDDHREIEARSGRDSRYSSMGSDSRFAGVAVPASLERRLRSTQL